MNPTRLPYRYTAIDADTEVRLLALQPSPEFSRPLTTTLVHRRMVYDIKSHKDITTPNYEAVSYCWGESVFSLELVCDGLALKITANVDSLLRHLRKKDRPRWLWVDAICINQEDDADKAQQVPRMDVIFGRAKKVHVWLGEEKTGDNISLTFKYLQDMASVLNVKIEEKKSNRTLSVEQGRMVARLFSRPWFCRRWILQEVAVAQDITVHCDSFKIPWRTFMVIPNAVHSATSTSSGPTQHLPKEVIDAIQIPVLLEQRQYDIFDLLRQCHLHECKDERDRLFSLYGMASIYSSESKTLVSIKDFFPVSYEHSWLDVYVAFATKSVYIGNGHKILEHVFEFGSLYQQNSNWPSWVPSWNFKRRLKCPFFTRSANKWDGTGWSGWSLSGKMGISLHGATSHTLHLVPWPDFTLDSPRHPYIHFLSTLFSPLGFLAHHRSIIHDLDKLFAYYGHDDVSATAKPETACCPNRDHDCVANHLLKELRLFRTHRLGYDVVGLGPGSIRPEDLVVTVSETPSWGAEPVSCLEPESFTFLVRPASDVPTNDEFRGCAFRLVGWCYVYNDSKAFMKRPKGGPRVVILV